MHSAAPSSLRFRLVALILSILAPLLLIVVVDARRQFRQAEAELRDDTQRFAQFAARDVAQLLDSTRVSGLMSLFPPGMVLTVMKRDGTILARYPEAETWTGRVLPNTPLLKTALATGGEGTVEAQGVDGVVRTYSFCPVKDASHGLFVGVGRSRDRAFARARHALLLNLDITVGAGAILLLVAWFGSSIFILRPLDVLVNAVRKVGQGELGARARITGGPREIVSVALAFDTMAAALQERDEERCRHEALLIEYGSQLRSLTMEASLAEERERRRIALGLHDSIGQLLATCYMKLGRAGPGHCRKPEAIEGGPR